MAYYCWQIYRIIIAKVFFCIFYHFLYCLTGLKFSDHFKLIKPKRVFLSAENGKFPHVVKIYNSMKAASVYISNYTFQNLRLCFHKIYIVTLTVVWGKDLLERTHFEKFWSFALFCKTDLHFFRTRKVPCWDFEIR